MLTTDISKAEQKIKDAYLQMRKTQQTANESKEQKLNRAKSRTQNKVK